MLYQIRINIKMYHLCAVLLGVLFVVVPSVKGKCDLGIYQQGVNITEQNIIVNKHNNFRLLLAQGKIPNQPRAINLKRMYYDATLAAKAQDIANTCVFGHVNVVDDRWTWVGQNIYITMSTSCESGSEWDRAIQSWFDEYKVYHYPDDSSAATGHYTQIAWASTQYVGCGYTFFPSTGQYRCKKYYVCNYGPGGNYAGQAPYQTGPGGCENLC